MSIDINTIVISGRLGRNPDVKPLGNQNLLVGRFSIAVNAGFGEKKETYWFNVVCFRKLAELAEKYLEKGSKVCVVGTLKQSTYVSTKDGLKKEKIEIIATEIHFLSQGKTVEKQPDIFSKLNKEIEQQAVHNQDVGTQPQPPDEDIPF